MIRILVRPATSRSPGFLSRCSDLCAMLSQLVRFSLAIFYESSMARSVLIVDDDPVQRRLLEAAVAKAGYQAVTADSGEAALAAFERGADIGVVILDLVMPGMDGLEVIKRMRERDIEFPVIVQTAKGSIDTAV